MFIYQCKMLKLFLGIFTRFTRIFKIIFTQVLTQTVADRPGRSTGRSTEPRAGRPLRSTDVHSLVHVYQAMGRSTRRSTGPESVALCIWAVDRAVDRNRELCSLYLGGRPCGRPGAPTVRFSTIGGRPAGRPQVCQTDRSA